jgi:hypothetical protein
MFTVLKYRQPDVKAIFEGGYDKGISGLVVKPYLPQYIAIYII